MLEIFLLELSYSTYIEIFEIGPSFIWPPISMPLIHVAPFQQEPELGIESDDYKLKWINAIISNDSNLVRQMIGDISYDILGINFSTVLTEELDTIAYIKQHCHGPEKAYIPHDPWCLAALYNARDVLHVLREFGFLTTQANSHGNTFLHCIIAHVSLDGEEHEDKTLSTIKLIRVLISSEEYNKVLLTENEDGLRPLELASHLGTFALFQFLFNTEGTYKRKINNFSMFSVEYFDVTEYVIGKRYFKSPIFTMMLVDRSKINHSHLRTALHSDPMKTWFTAIRYSNIPYIIVLALLRFVNVASYFVILFLMKSNFIQSEEKPNQQILEMNVTTNYSDIVSDNGLLCFALSYSTVYSISVLSFHVVYLCVCLVLRYEMKWSKRIVRRNKDHIAYRMTYLIANIFNLTCVLLICMDIWLQMSTGTGKQTVLSDSMDVTVWVATYTCVWDILYYLQLIPGLNLYIVAIQRMLTDFLAFEVIFMLFFCSYIIGFYILEGDAGNFFDSAYDTFKLMLNSFTYTDASATVSILHVTFVFLVAYLLQNILIAIFASSYEFVYKERHIIFAVQSLSVYLSVDPIMSSLLGRLHRYLQRKHFVFEDGKIYIIKVVKKPRWFQQMETFSVLLVLSAAISQVTGEFPS